MMSRLTSRLRHKTWLCLLAAISCQSAAIEPETGGETHFLSACDNDPDACGTQFACVCNVCTLPCSEQATCSGVPNARCVQFEQPNACEDVAAAGRCDLTCAGDADCAALSSRHVCDQGACRAPGSEPAPPDASMCEDPQLDIRQMDANEVVVLGDAFIATTHEVTGFLEEQARATGALGPGQRYRDASSLTNNTLALSGNGIAAQYSGATAEGDVRVVIMTGGGADALLGSCETIDATCPALTSTITAAEELLTQMADDGVARVVYLFYPDPSDPELLAKLEVLRPAIRDLCEAGPAACDWLDLRPRFVGREDEYLQSGGLALTSAGAQVVADEIWSVMQSWCSG